MAKRGTFAIGGDAFDVYGATLANVTASQTDSAIVTAVAGKKIRVLTYILSASGTASAVTFNSKPSGAGAAISPTLKAGDPVPQFLEFGWFETVAGEGLSVTTGAGSTTGIQVIYTLA